MKWRNKYIIVLIILMLMLFCYLLTNRKINVSLINLKVAEENAESWEEFDYRDTTITYDYFVNANQWHYDINRVMDIACIATIVGLNGYRFIIEVSSGARIELYEDEIEFD